MLFFKKDLEKIQVSLVFQRNRVVVVGKKSSGDFGRKMEFDEIFLLEEQLVQLSVKGFKIILTEKLTLMCSV